MITVECPKCNNLDTESSIVCEGCYDELQTKLKEYEKGFWGRACAIAVKENKILRKALEKNKTD